jgi:uncharacterized protein (UPF0335 family)
MTDIISNTNDVIDSRDIIERIEELEGERDSLQSDYDEALEAFNEADKTLSEAEAQDERGEVDTDTLQNAKDEAHDTMIDTREALDAWNTSDEAKELAALQSVAEQAEGYASDWRHGETLIRDDYFEDYARQLAEDCGMVKEGAQWPNNCIDWEQAASELQTDYTSIDFDGVTYWIR